MWGAFLSASRWFGVFGGVAERQELAASASAHVASGRSVRRMSTPSTVTARLPTVNRRSRPSVCNLGSQRLVAPSIQVIVS
jgi:hypothetical protein